MAVRFSASGRSYTRTISPGSISAYTIMAWVRIVVDRNALSTIWSLDTNSTSTVECVQTATDGVTFGIETDNGTEDIFVATVGSWLFVALSRSAGPVGTAYYRADGDTGLTSITLASTSHLHSSFSPTRLRIGDSPWGGEWINGNIAAVKVWTGVGLSADAIYTESCQYQPVRTANLLGYYPFLNAETADYSGNGNTLSGGTSNTTEAGPSIPWDCQTGSILDSYPDPTIPLGSFFLAA